MNILYLVFSMYLSLILASEPVPPITGPVFPPDPDQTQFEWQGVNVIKYGNWFDIEETRQHSVAVFSRLQKNNVNAVSISFPFFQDSWTASSVYTDPELTPTDDRLAVMIAVAHSYGIKVMLRPLMDERAMVRDGKWRGNICPLDDESWFRSYGALLRHYAEFAEANNVEIFNIGSELNSISGLAEICDGAVDTNQWFAVISDVRSRYNGALTYSANWGAHEQVPFWEEIDLIGIDAFFSLEVEKDGATVDELVTAWNVWIDRLNESDALVGKSILFTEIGTASYLGSYRTPWRGGNSEDTPDQLDQANYYIASCIASQQLNNFVGMFWWAVGSEMPTFDPMLDTQFNPLSKLAEEELRRCFTRIYNQDQGDVDLG